jgi:hypothetical protein
MSCVCGDSRVNKYEIVFCKGGDETGAATFIMSDETEGTTFDDGTIAKRIKLETDEDGGQGHIEANDEDGIGNAMEISAQEYTVYTSRSRFDQGMQNPTTMPRATPFAFARFLVTDTSNETGTINHVCGFNIASITYAPMTSTGGGSSALPMIGNPRYFVYFTDPAPSKDSYVVQALCGGLGAGTGTNTSLSSFAQVAFVALPVIHPLPIVQHCAHRLPPLRIAQVKWGGGYIARTGSDSFVLQHMLRIVQEPLQWGIQRILHTFVKFISSYGT